MTVFPTFLRQGNQAGIAGFSVRPQQTLHIDNVAGAPVIISLKIEEVTI